MKKTLSMILSILLVLNVLFACAIGATAEKSEIENLWAEKLEYDSKYFKPEDYENPGYEYYRCLPMKRFIPMRERFRYCFTQTKLMSLPFQEAMLSGKDCLQLELFRWLPYSPLAFWRMSALVLGSTARSLRNW